jgi:tetratricopeptide (TPR) repeat protein
MRFPIVFVVLFTALALAQSSPDKPMDTAPDKANTKASVLKPPSDATASAPATADRSGSDQGFSSSRDTRIDINPPKDDAKDHPGSKAAIDALELDERDDSSDTSNVQEFHPWDPMKSMKDIEVGDFYFKHKNYKAALDRYKEALYYKDNDAVAIIRLAECQEKLGDRAEARKYYEQYLKTLPDGPNAKDAHAGLERLEARK